MSRTSGTSKRVNDGILCHCALRSRCGLRFLGLPSQGYRAKRFLTLSAYPRTQHIKTRCVSEGLFSDRFLFIDRSLTRNPKVADVCASRAEICESDLGECLWSVPAVQRVGMNGCSGRAHFVPLGGFPVRRTIGLLCFPVYVNRPFLPHKCCFYSAAAAIDATSNRSLQAFVRRWAGRL